jgi:hypothetical protein
VKIFIESYIKKYFFLIIILCIFIFIGCIEIDSDNDGFPDTIDDFPNNKFEWKDTDGDGFGDNSDDFINDSNLYKKIIVEGTNTLFSDDVNAYELKSDENKSFNFYVEIEAKYVVYDIIYRYINKNETTVYFDSYNNLYFNITNPYEHIVFNNGDIEKSSFEPNKITINSNNWGEWNFFIENKMYKKNDYFINNSIFFVILIHIYY